MNQISFKGAFINPVNIKKIDGNQYKDFQASFVELNPKDRADIDMLNKIQMTWRGDFTETIFNSAFCSSFIDNDKKKFYALTSQQDSFDKLDAKKVLGVVELNKLKHINRIEFLQVNPNYIVGKPKSWIGKLFSSTRNKEQSLPLFKRVGSAILDSLKKITDKPLDLLSVENATGFYRKNGFVRKSIFNSHYFIWRKNNGYIF